EGERCVATRNCAGTWRGERPRRLPDRRLLLADQSLRAGLLARHGQRRRRHRREQRARREPGRLHRRLRARGAAVVRGRRGRLRLGAATAAPGHRALDRRGMRRGPRLLRPAAALADRAVAALLAVAAAAAGIVLIAGEAGCPPCPDTRSIGRGWFRKRPSPPRRPTR